MLNNIFRQLVRRAMTCAGTLLILVFADLAAITDDLIGRKILGDGVHEVITLPCIGVLVVGMLVSLLTKRQNRKNRKIWS